LKRNELNREGSQDGIQDGSPDRPYYNSIPRRGGRFFWQQFYEFLNLGNQTVGIAMFDEVDEGTAIFKLANSEALTPRNVPNLADFPGGVTDYFVHLNQGDDPFPNRASAINNGAQTYPTDWYLQLAKEAFKKIRILRDNTQPFTISPIRPINP
jgi:hypothetical protein